MTWLHFAKQYTLLLTAVFFSRRDMKKGESLMTLWAQKKELTTNSLFAELCVLLRLSISNFFSLCCRNSFARRESTIQENISILNSNDQSLIFLTLYIFSRSDGNQQKWKGDGGGVGDLISQTPLITRHFETNFSCSRLYPCWRRKKFTSLKILWHHRQKSRLTKGIQHFLFTQFSFFFVVVLNLHDSVMSARKSVGGLKRMARKKKANISEIKEGWTEEATWVWQMKRENLVKSL